MKYRAIIFDMDGTIVDTGHIWEYAAKQLIEKRGITLNAQLKKELKHRSNGFGLPQTCKLIKEMANLEESVEALMQEKFTTVKIQYKKELRFIKGFKDFYVKAQTHKLSMAIATNADNPTLALTNAILKLEQFFGHHMYTLDHVNNRGKPNPDVYLHAAQKLGIPTNCTLAIEDSAHGIAAAQAAGLFCIGLNSSQRIEQVQHADLIVNSYDEIDLDNLLKQ